MVHLLNMFNELREKITQAAVKGAVRWSLEYKVATHQADYYELKNELWNCDQSSAKAELIRLAATFPYDIARAWGGEKAISEIRDRAGFDLFEGKY